MGVDATRGPRPVPRDVELGRVLWDWLQVGDAPAPADVIVVLGSQDLRVLDRGAELFHLGFAPRLLLSGGRGRRTRDWPVPEAVAFAERAAELGVPRQALLTEPDSSNTGENIRFSARVLEREGIPPRRWLLVHKPYLERRTRATAASQAPGIETLVASPAIGYEGWPTAGFPWSEFLRSLVGTLARMLEYPRRGYQVAETVPEDVLEAGRELVKRGYGEGLEEARTG